jgi:hypothetical protein
MTIAFIWFSPRLTMRLAACVYMTFMFAVFDLALVLELWNR